MDLILSDKQKHFIRDSNAKINIAHGAIRSGKTFSSLIRWGMHVHSCPALKSEQLVMVGYSYDTVVKNAVYPFMERFDGFCSWSPGNHTLTFMGDKKITCMGANDQGAVGKIQGATVSGAYVDEMTLISPNFLDMLYSRLSRPCSRLFGTTNPSAPSHPIKQLIDAQDGKDIYALHFELDDNLTLDEDYKNMIRNKLYSSLWKQRYVDGLWIAAEGMIYQGFSRKHSVRSQYPYSKQYMVGVDYGTSNPFAALLIGYNPDVHPSLSVIKEYYWDPKQTYQQKTNSQFADAIQFAFDGYPIKHVYLDPSAESFEVELRKRKMPVWQADNDVLNGIQLVDELFSSGDLVIDPSCVNLIRELESYSWDPKAEKNGEEKPIKQGDHACLVGDTLISTLHGEIKIEDLVDCEGEIPGISYNRTEEVFETDYLKNCCLTRKDAEIYELELQDGKKIKATGDHKIMTQRGLVELQQLTLCDMILTCNIKNISEKSST